MTSKSTNEDTSRFSLADKKINIVCPGKFQRELMARILEEETGAKCDCFEDINGLEIPKNEENGDDTLILIDSSGIDVKEIVSREIPVIIALFNVERDRKIEEEITGRRISGIFYSSDPLNQFLKGMSAIFKGELWFSREVMAGLVRNNSNSFSNNVKDLLTHREIEILSLIAVGEKNEDIAEKLYVSTNTVKTNIYNIFKKINVSNRLQAALWAAKNL